MGEVFDPETQRLRVMADRCPTCIFRPGNLMHLKPGRVRDMVEAARADEWGSIHCHDTLPIVDPPEGKSAICRGWWDGYAEEKFWARMLRAAARIDWWIPKKEGQ